MRQSLQIAEIVAATFGARVPFAHFIVADECRSVTTAL
jgi:hypothetical protein